MLDVREFSLQRFERFWRQRLQQKIVGLRSGIVHCLTLKLGSLAIEGQYVETFKRQMSELILHIKSKCTTSDGRDEEPEVCLNPGRYFLFLSVHQAIQCIVWRTFHFILSLKSSFT